MRIYHVEPCRDVNKNFIYKIATSLNLNGCEKKERSIFGRFLVRVKLRLIISKEQINIR